MLYEVGKELAHALLVNAPLRTRGTDGIERQFAVLAPQDVKIGTHVFYRIPFVTPINPSKEVPKVDFDRLLPTVLFQRAFISYRDYYAVLNPW